ncbi:hypothetical protein FB451DRAFT_1243255 [Mycena latifolia]|nr:hypothetical protein FB451DRAFT_1243255 [Mycena latifolia]
MPLALPPLLLALVLALLSLPAAHAAETNVTIDDSNGAYFSWTEDTGTPRPTLPWAAITPATPCAYCSAQPQTGDIENKTWHDGTNNSAGALTFQGAAVYLYGIDLANPANISFALDGAPAGFHHYDGAAQFVFRALFFAQQNLDATVNHTLAWVLHATATNGTVGLIDYAVVTLDAGGSASASNPASTGTSSPSTSKKKSPAGPIAGGVIGGLALVLLITAAVFFCTRRRRRDASNPLDARPFAGVPAMSEAGGARAGGEKTLDVSWTHPAPAPAPSSVAPPSESPPSSAVPPSSVSAAPPTVSSLPASQAQLSSPPVTETQTAPLSSGAASTSPPSAPSVSERERALEERLAHLEAQVLAVAPPAYDHARAPP